MQNCQEKRQGRKNRSEQRAKLSPLTQAINAHMREAEKSRKQKEGQINRELNPNPFTETILLPIITCMDHKVDLF